MNKTPKHYDKSPSPLEVIEAWNLGFLEGNLLKYLARWKEKGGIDDLEKMKHYVYLLIESARKAEHRTKATESASSASSASVTYDLDPELTNYG